jgi:PAS domain S-box-containing protein
MPTRMPQGTLRSSTSGDAGSPLRDERERDLADFFENAAIGFHLVGPDGTILRANRAELELLGYAPDEYIGHHISEFHLDPPVIEEILKRLTCGEILRGREARLRCKDGSVRHVLIDSSALFEDGKFIHTRCTTRNVTDQKLLEAERDLLLLAEREARSQAEAASRAKDEFLSVISHELRSPLGAILGWTAVLKAGASGEKATRAIETIERSGRMQAKLIEDLLDTSRIVSGRMRLDLRLIDLPTVVRSALEAVRPTADAKGVRLEIRLDASAGPLSGDRDRLEQVVWNLLSNAVKFTPAGGLVEVGLARRDDDVCLTVSDSGRGIARDFLPFLFERFTQSEAASTRGTTGVGLGLAIARHLIELHGGSIAAASDGEGKGATFTVTLPLPPALGGEEHRRSRPLEGLRVLVVEDDFDALDALRLALEERGARVTSAGSVREATRVASQSAPDAIISDIHLPDGDGYALMRELRSKEELRSVPAIAVSGYGDSDDGGSAAAAGFQRRFRKPLVAGTIATALSDLIAGSSRSTSEQDEHPSR